MRFIFSSRALAIALALSAVFSVDAVAEFRAASFTGTSAGYNNFSGYNTSSLPYSGVGNLYQNGITNYAIAQNPYQNVGYPQLPPPFPPYLGNQGPSLGGGLHDCGPQGGISPYGFGQQGFGQQGYGQQGFGNNQFGYAAHPWGNGHRHHHWRGNGFPVASNWGNSGYGNSGYGNYNSYGSNSGYGAGYNGMNNGFATLY